MPPITLAALIPVALLFPLAATIRQTLPNTDRCRGSATALLSGAYWLVPLIFIVPMTTGLMLTGRLSPLPSRALAAVATSHGDAIGIAAAIAVTMTILWLTITPAMLVLRFSDPAKRDRLRAVIPLNLVLGLSFLVLVWVAWR